MFDYFRDKCKDCYYEGYDELIYNKNYSYRFAPFLKNMDYFSYDVENAIITMITKEGDIYNLDELIQFNKENKKYLKIIGVGNEFSPIIKDSESAIIEFKVSKYFKKDINDIQLAVRKRELTDTFDIYPLDIIEKRTAEALKEYGISEITLIGDYAKGNPTKESTIDFAIDEMELMDILKFHRLLKTKFKYNVRFFEEKDIGKNCIQISADSEE